MACCCAVAPTETENVVVSTNKVVQEEQAEEDPPVVFDPPADPPPVVEKAPEPTAEPAAAPAAQLTVNVSKDGGKMLGLEVAFLGDNIMFVEKVQAEGAVAAYNEANPGAILEAGDHILTVNKVAGSAGLELLQKENNIELTVNKCKEVTLTIPKDGKLGLDLTYQEEKEYMMVRGLVEGCVQAYNAKASADQQFKVPSRIVGVDGVRGKASEMFKKLQAAGSSVEFAVCQTIG